MTDSRLRDLERRYAQSGAVDDRLAYDIARVRAGEAIETGFIARVADKAGAYRDKGRVYLPQSEPKTVSFRPLIGRDFVVSDIEFADGEFHVLAFRRIGTDCLTRVLSVDSAGQLRTSWESNEAYGGVPSALLNYDGALGRIYTAACAVEFANQRVDFLREQTLFGYTQKYGFLGTQPGTMVGGNTQVVTLKEGRRPQLLWDGRRKMHGVFVEGNEVRCEPDLHRVETFAGTRLMDKRYFAASELALLRGYQGRALTLTKTLLEVPKKSLEGLLLALKRS